MKEIKIYQIILVICAVLIGSLACYADNLNRKIDDMQQPCETCQIGVEVENYILDVIYETDFFNKITVEESKVLQDLEEDDYPKYCVELMVLYGKYYGGE